MLADKDRIFTNLYGFQPWNLKSAQARGDWDKTKDPMSRGQDSIIEEIKLTVTVRSATGWSTRLPPDEVADALLATHVAGEPLPTANGAPLRLVAPHRRGLDWVKWVVEIEVG